ncbi:MAG: hypothetical protein IKB02_05305 [Clostridia bacterium]|nr:hypothetical protein [Clostridia bacterium]
MKGYKGFEKGLICRGKQYAENTVFEEEKAVICNSGMHFCENPFDVLDYYGLVCDDGSFNDFAEVEALAEAKTDDNKKFCTTKLKVGAKLTFAGFIKACIDFVLEKTTVDIPDSKVNDKDESVISSKPRKAQIGSSGDYAKIGSSGDSAQIGSSGDYAQIGSSGDYAKIGSSGDYAQIGSSGDYAKIGSSGYYAKIGSSGYSAQIGSSGDYAQIGSSGYYAQIGSSGYYAKIGSSGDSAKIDSTGKNAVVMCAGNNSIAKAKIGSWITLSEWKSIDGVYTPVCVKTEKVDGERIKEDTFYKLINGEFLEI